MSQNAPPKPQTPDDWLLAATPDPQVVTSDWERVGRASIAGVEVKEVRNVLTATGSLTEIFRGDWGSANTRVDQVFVRTLEPGAISAWHCHAHTTDRLACVRGRIELALFDGRANSPTRRQVWVSILGSDRPATITVPPGVWHGTRNLSSEMSIIVNCVDHAYAYEAPDHWRLPADTSDIPYSFLPR